MSKRASSLVVMTILAGAGCTRPSPLDPGSEAPAVASLMAGRIVLTCGEPCYSPWDAALHELDRRYIAGDWRGLATRIEQIRYREDLAYFYLGRAAEELGAAGAVALRYYRSAQALAAGADRAARCSNFFHGCNGLNVTSELGRRVAGLEARLPRSAGRKQRGRLPSEEDAAVQAPNEANSPAPIEARVPRLPSASLTGEGPDHTPVIPPAVER